MSEVIKKTKLNERLRRVTETYRNPCVQHKREEKQTRKKYCMFSNTIHCVVQWVHSLTKHYGSNVRQTDITYLLSLPYCTTMCT